MVEVEERVIEVDIELTVKSLTGKIGAAGL